MDLKITSEPPSVKPAPMRVGDLLHQLRTAGTVEAEVIKLLNENQLLLNSRLGQILASNSLDYKAGDRVNLRLDESSGQPVLKASPAEVNPIRLDNREFPQLARALPPERPLLARVARIAARHAEIRLGEQTIRLPRELVLAKSQLLSLLRRDDQRSIEIRPLPDKAIYKAIVKQLLPRHTPARESALVRLLEFSRIPPVGVKSFTATTQPAMPSDRSESIATTGRDSSRAATAAATSTGLSPGRQAPAPATAPASSVARNASSIDTKIKTPLASPRQPGPAARPARADADALQNTAAAEKNRQRNIDNRIPSWRSVAVTRPGLAPALVTSPTAAAMPSASAGFKVMSPHSGQPKTSIARELPSGVTSAGNMSPGQIKPGAGMVQATATKPAGANPITPGASYPSATTLPALQPLLQLVSALASLDAPQVRKWFEFARLVRTVPNPGQASAGGDIFRLLQPLAQGPGSSREPMSPVAQKSTGAAAGEATSQKPNAEETHWLQLRETATRLIDQSLSQNLLQRATLGMQQETQQPLNLSLALPFIDQQQLRPIYIDLEQRKQALDEADRSWEIRLNLELGGLGCIACHLLLEGMAVAASFYSDNEKTRARIETELPQLRQQLAGAGFNPGEFHSFSGLPAPAKQPGASEFAETLIDLEA